MKKILSLFSFLLVSFQLFCINDINLIDENLSSVTVAVNFDQFTISSAAEINGVMHSKISAENTYPSLVLGSPDLPRLTCAIQLPNSGVSSYSIVSSSFKEYFNVELIPSKGNLKRNF